MKSPHPFASSLMLSLTLLALAGCQVGPRYNKPGASPATGWTEAGRDHISTASLAAAPWWTLFKDPGLDALIDRARKSNLDLRLAGERITQAKAQRQIIAADLFPTVNAAAAASRIRVSGVTNAGRSTLESNLYQAGFDSSWELDIFGGNRRAVESADAEIQVTEENRNAVLVALDGEVARNYVQLRGLQLQVDVTSKTIAAQGKTYDLTRMRFDAGIASQLDVERARAQLESTRSQAPVLETALHETIHRLSVLLGQEPGALTQELTPPAPIPVPPGVVTVGVPSELLRRRPDIRSAERELAAQTARIGVAVADLYPKFMLSGALGTQGLRADDLFDGAARFWSLGPSVRWPVLDFGRIRGNIKVQNSLLQQALIRYQQTILDALEECENAFVGYAEDQVRRQSLQEAVAANQKSVDLATMQYSAGVTDFLNVLDAQRTLYASQILLAQNESAVSADLVALYKALGGGWDVKAK